MNLMSFNEATMSKPHNIPEEIWNRFQEYIKKENISLNINDQCGVIFIDDNMYLHSMRYPYLKMAKQCK